MTSSLTFFVFSAFVVCVAQGQLSSHDKEVKDAILKDVKDALPKGCSDAIAKGAIAVNTDSKIDSFCQNIGSLKLQIDAACHKSGFDKVKKIACDHINESNAKKDKKIDNFKNVFKTLSQMCRVSIATPNPTTWFQFEEMCKAVTENKKAYETTCSSDGYDKLKGAVCGASAIFSGFLTVAFCLALSFLKNL